MRKSVPPFLIRLLTLPVLLVFSPLFAGTLTPVFLIYEDGVDIMAEARRLELNGARVRQRIPPQILVVELPDSIKPGKISGTKTATTSAVSLSTLGPYGPAAVAAGLQWNRTALRSATASGVGVSAMRTLVAQKSLPAAPKPTLTVSGEASFRAAWDALDGALTYDIEAALDSSFVQPFCATRNNRPEADLPLPEGSGAVTIYLRVRGIDTVEAADGTRKDVFGAWSQRASLAVNATPSDNSLLVPSPTSPVPDYVSEGFTLILEWIAGAAPLTRVQAARSDDFQSTLYDTVAVGGDYVVPSPGLRVGDTLYWRVKAWGAQKSGWSPVRSLRIGAPRHDRTDMFVNPEAPQ